MGRVLREARELCIRGRRRPSRRSFCLLAPDLRGERSHRRGPRRDLFRNRCRRPIDFRFADSLENPDAHHRVAVRFSFRRP